MDHLDAATVFPLFARIVHQKATELHCILLFMLYLPTQLSTLIFPPHCSSDNFFRSSARRQNLNCAGTSRLHAFAQPVAICISRAKPSWPRKKGKRALAIIGGKKILFGLTKPTKPRTIH